MFNLIFGKTAVMEEILRESRKPLWTWYTPMQGWQCPMCLRAYSPFTKSCDCQVKSDSGVTSNSHPEKPDGSKK